MGSVIELKAKWSADAVEVLTKAISHQEYEKLIAELAEVIYCHQSQLPKDQNLTLELLTLPNVAEKIEVKHAA